MTVSLPYGDSVISLDLPSHFHVETLIPHTDLPPVDVAAFSTIAQQTGAIAALRHARPLVIVNDGYRHTPTAAILDFISAVEPEFTDRATFLVATGTHPAPTATHFRQMFGKHLAKTENRYFVHSATDAGSMVQVGSDQFGQPVCLNKLLFEYEQLIVIGSVEPHYFAGFTGGRKSIFPGLCDLATTERNHNLAASLSAAPLKLRGNPVAEHLDALIRLVKLPPLLSIQAVTDQQGRPISISVGDMETCFRNACEVAARVYAHRVDKRFDLVFACLQPPLDANLYQAQKAAENCLAGVRDQGDLVVVSPCHEGVGSAHFLSETANWDRVANAPRDGVRRFGSHKLARMVAAQERVNVHLHSEVDPQTVSATFYHPATDLARIVSRQPQACRVAVLPDAGNTVLYCQSCNP